ncbi:hypothetical protein KUL25_20760 [Rhodobacteraceae bacterium N5(2021)]|uniref:Uncharacterized protein n=1 Tax=Gymnodinialimonas phycosphaerae TaxID=2841589 RepID=A0A975YFU8_9RHOB|nr:hypothetical protein [Gymnodinialimonas phycosphaerae]MBY4895201.1 hypothetical protein [Gymnodinialimonas phycosphaerae]
MPFSLSLSLALAGPASAQSGDAVQRLAAAMAAAGCLANGANGDVILQAAGLTEDEAGAAVEAMMATGDVVMGDDGLLLTTGECAGGASGAAADVFVATQWANALSAADAAAFLELELAAVGCAITDETAEAFEENVARNIAIFNGVELPGPVATLSRDAYGAFLDAVDELGNRGGAYLDDAGRIDDSTPGVYRLIGCTAGMGGTGVDAAPAVIDTAAVNAALFGYGREELIAVEAELFTQIECMIPSDMGFAFQAMMLDRILTDSGLPMGPDAAIVAMADRRLGSTSTHPQAAEVGYAALIVDEITGDMVTGGRVEVEGRMWLARDCEPAPTSHQINLRPYLIGTQ